MFLRCKVRRKDGKQHRYFSVVENTRVAGGRVVQRHVLYLGEINDTQEVAWRRSIEVLEDDQAATCTPGRAPNQIGRACSDVTPNRHRPRCGSLVTRRWRERDSNPRSPGQGEFSCRAMRAEVARTSCAHFGAGAAAVQLDLFCSACHSIEPGAHTVWVGCGLEHCSARSTSACWR